MRPRSSKLRVGWIMPCMGIGGADAYTLGLIRYMHNVKHTGLVIGDPPKHAQIEWALNMMGRLCPVHMKRGNHTMFEGIDYHNEFASAVYAACYDADIIVSWGFGHLEANTAALDVPIVELAQNEDTWFEDVTKGNADAVHFRAAVSENSSKVFSPEKCDAVIYNAIDPGRVTPKWGREEYRKMCGFKPTDKVMLFMGRFVEEKHPKSLIYALQHLPKDYHAVYVGRGYLDEEMERTAKDLRVHDRVHFQNPQYHVGDLLAMADMFILPSDFEGHPLAVCEAWLAGCPTVLTELDVYEEFRSGELGWMLPIGHDVPQLVEKILEVDPTDVRVGRARQLAWDHFTLPHAALLWEEFLSACLERWRRSKRRPKMFGLDDPEPLKSSKASIQKVKLHGD